MREENYRETKDFEGDTKPVFDQVAKDYQLGDFIDSRKVEMGYEDSNYAVKTITGEYFVKIFGGYRDTEECRRYIGIIEKALEAGVSHPKMYKGPKGSLDHLEDSNTNLAVFEYINGKTFYELGRSPDEEETKEIVKQAATINTIDFRPTFVYDEWAVTNIEDQFKITEQHLLKEEKSAIAPLVASFKGVDVKSLPHAFVHGDLLTTNVMKSKEDGLYVFDFACANYYPRIMELAVLICNLLKDQDSKFVVDEYQKHLKLTDDELKNLPLFVDLAHAMHVIGGRRESSMHGNESEENAYWLEQGRKGLGLK